MKPLHSSHPFDLKDSGLNKITGSSFDGTGNDACAPTGSGSFLRYRLIFKSYLKFHYLSQKITHFLHDQKTYRLIIFKKSFLSTLLTKKILLQCSNVMQKFCSNSLIECKQKKLSENYQLVIEQIHLEFVYNRASAYG